MEVAGIFLGPIFEMLLEKLASRAVSNHARREGIHRELKKLEKLLPDIRVVLADAEEKQMTNDRVKSWMEDLNDVAFDLDDLLDDIATEALRLELNMPESEASSSSSKVRKLLIPTCCTSSSSSTPIAVKLDHSMMSKVEEIIARLENIETRKNSLNLIEIVEGNRSNRVRKRRETSSLMDKSHVYGRENDKEAILDLLIDEASVDNKVSVIPIVGMGGVGKTTLAKLVYDNERLKGHFDLKAWVCVSDDFDIVGVTKKILEAVTSTTHKDEALDMLQQKLKTNLSGKRFLLVLDDVWNENHEEWDDLRCPFLDGAPGSKIIVTTRHTNVASAMSLSPAYPLKELSEDECLSLFTHHALERENFNEHPNLKGIGEEIVKKCKGLPLAAKTLGGLLRNKPRQREWENILNSKMWDLPEEKSGILSALRLSYHHLPSHLKQCFAYCAIFPKDYLFDKDELVLWWMGVGLLQLSKQKQEKRMEDFGDECFDDLLSRSFFQQSSGSKSKFVMHDLLNDLALHIAGDICFILDKLEVNEHFEIPKRARHLSYIRQRFEVIQKFKPLCKVQHLRTLLPLPVYMSFQWTKAYLANKVLSDFLPNLHCLRVLSFSCCTITKLPDSIGDLKHLRYLNLSGSLIRQLPESLSTLYNLQILLLRRCNNLCMLPTNIVNLINLRHLDITDTPQLREMSSGIGKLTNLQTLSKFIVGKNNGPGVQELRNLRLLHGSISIRELQNVMDLQDANEANLRAKKDLDEVELVWCSDFNDFRNENLEMNVLDKVQPHINLKRLKIEFYGGTKFSSWIGHPSFSEMVKLSLVGCRKCKSLPPLGQLCILKELCIEGMHEVQNLGIEFYGDRFPLGLPFPSLQRLKFEDMPAWEKWSCSIGVVEDGRQFPCLCELTIVGCPKLITVSLLRLPSLQKLDLVSCQEVVLKSIVDVTSLTSLYVDSIVGLSYLEEAWVQSLGALESLEFRNCNQLTALWQNGRGVTENATQKNNLVSLRRVRVVSCPQLVSFGEGLDEEGLPCINLQEMYIQDCENLEKLPNELNNLASLTRLEILGCSKFVRFPKTGVPPTLKYLHIWYCEALESLPDGICGIEKLEINYCPSLRSWPTNTLPTALKTLCINLGNFSKVAETTIMMVRQEEEGFNNINVINMSTLELLQIRKWPKVGRLLLGGYNNFPSLRELSIWDCDVVNSLSFLESGFPNLRSLVVGKCVNLRSLPTNHIPHNLESLEIHDCLSVESFLERGYLSTTNLRSPIFDQILPSLKSLVITDCPFLESFPYANGNLPPNLIKVRISSGGKLLKPLSEWGLHRLTSLQELEIEGGYPDLVSFPHEYCLFPATLTKLIIKDLPNLVSISSKGLQNLTSLHHLIILDCPKLRSLPKEGLPSTFRSLQTRGCPFLEERCSEEDEGDYWPKIAHIPCVAIDTDLVFYG